MWRHPSVVSLALTSSIGAFALACDGAPATTAGRCGVHLDSVVAPATQTSRVSGSPELVRTTIWNRAPDRASVAGQPDPGLSVSPAEGMAVSPAASAHTLILYDTGGEFGWLGELYAASTANLASHFGSWRAVPARDYQCGDIASFTATIYLGSSYDEPLPPCLLDDVAHTSLPVMWVDSNSWQLVMHVGATEFAARYGFSATHLLDPGASSFSSVAYRGRTLTRQAAGSQLLSIEISDAARATELATATRDDGTTVPWAVRSGNLTVVAEIPFSFSSETDRVLVFEDLLFDLLQPAATERHRALVRLEDIGPTSDPNALHAIADYLSSRSVPFGFGVISAYRDPLGYYHQCSPNDLGFSDEPALVEALHYLESHGGTMVMHGWTHQWDGGANPYDEVSGDDTEFFRITQSPDETFDYVGPLPEDSIEWASGRVRSAEDAFRTAGLTVPTIFEFPHYAASANAYAAVATMMSARWERGRYFSGVLGGGPIDHSHAVGQMFPFTVRDVYGSTVLPENLGNIDLTMWHGLPARSPEDIVGAADKQLVIRDGVASFFFHPFLPIEYLEQTVEGIRGLGYEFVSPLDL